MKVSIVMPFRNVEPYLATSIRSLIAQDHTHWELLAVDDHSTDRSADIAREMAASDPRIRVVTHIGQGIIPALVAAEQRISGEYVTRMDSDDIATPDRLSRMLSVLEKNADGHVAVGLVRYFSATGVSEGYQKYEDWLNLLTRTGSNFSEIYKECVVPSPCWMMKAKDFKAIGGFLADDYPEDYDLCFRMYRSGFNIAPVRRVLHWWRDYPERTSRNSSWYAQNSFLDLKLKYYLEVDHEYDRPLVVWGAGWKGKQIASQLQQFGVPFHWLCDNPRKWGKEIYGMPLLPLDAFDRIGPGKSIIAVANPLAQREIRTFMHNRQLRQHRDFVFFC